MAYNFHFDPVDLPPECEGIAPGGARLSAPGDRGRHLHAAWRRRRRSRASFTRKVGAKGWIGMTWPKKYGGHERSHLERYVVTEEMLAHRAPTRAHSTADRQSGPVILRYGQEEIKQNDPAAHRLGRTVLLHRPQRAQFRLRRVRRLDPRDQDRRRLAGQRPQDLDQQRAQFRLHDRAAAHLAQDQGEPPARADPVPGRDARSPGITIRPIINLTGAHDFNEVVFDDAFVPDLAPDRRSRHGLEAGDRRAGL